MNNWFTERIKEIYEAGGDWKAELKYQAGLFDMDPLDLVAGVMNDTYSQEDIDSAYDDGFHAGYDDGYETGYDDGLYEGEGLQE